MFRRIFFSCIICIVFYGANFAQLNTIRFGGGLGGSLYIGSQNDDQVSFDTYGKSEVNWGYSLALYKSIDDKSEVGFRYLSTILWSFKSENLLALNADIKEYAFIYQRSFNDNIAIDNSRLTVNGVVGLGLCYYSSIFYDATAGHGSLVPFSAVGYGQIPTVSGNILQDKQIDPVAILGINVGFRVNKFTTLYIENTLSVSNTNKISGNLFRKSLIPPDGYLYSSVAIYFNYTDFFKKNRVYCPKISSRF